MILWALGCHPEPAACEQQPCVTTVEPVVWTAPEFDWPGYAGVELALFEGTLLVGAPVVPGEYGNSRIYALDARTLDAGGSWAKGTQGLGYAIAAADGVGILLGERTYDTPSSIAPDTMLNGGVHRFDSPPDTRRVELPLRDQLWFSSLEDQVYVGTGVAFGDVVGEGRPFALFGGGAGPGSVVYVVDPTLPGPLTDTDAWLEVQGGTGLGMNLAVTDLDGDGSLDLALTTPGGAGWLSGPLPQGLFRLEDLPGGRWTPPEGLPVLGSDLKALGDLTGDGAPDLAIAELEHGTEAHPRSGAVWIAAGGDPRPGPVDDLPIRIVGEQTGEGVAYGLASGDLDGDGADDLLLGAPGVYPGVLPGRLLVFAGPLREGAFTSADADAALSGEYDWDLFGFDVLAADVDADGLAEVFVGAPGSPDLAGRGSVYLLRGGSLL